MKRLIIVGELWHNFRVDSWLAFRVAKDCVWFELCNVPMFLISINEDGWEFALFGISVHNILTKQGGGW